MAESEDYSRTIVRDVANNLILALRSRLKLDLDQCYLVAFISPVEGMPHGTVIQVAMGGATQYGGGDGGQAGGHLARDQQYVLGIFFTTEFGPHEMTEDAMLEVADGVLDYSERLRAMLAGAMIPDEDGNFSSQQMEQMRYISESAVQVVDADMVTLMKQIVFAVPLVVPLVDDTQTIGYSSTS